MTSKLIKTHQWAVKFGSFLRYRVGGFAQKRGNDNNKQKSQLGLKLITSCALISALNKIALMEFVHPILVLKEWLLRVVGKPAANFGILKCSINYELQNSTR